MQAKPTSGELWSLSCEAGSVERERSELRNLPCGTRSAERESKGTKATIDKIPSWTVFTWSPGCPPLQQSFLHTSHWSSWTVFTWTPRCHLLQKSLLHTSHWEIFLIIPHLLMKITNNYNFIIMFPIPSLSKPWEDIPLTQSFWTKFCPWLKLV